MSTKGEKIPIDLPIKMIGKWKETYRWIPIFGALASFAMSFCAGANSIPVPFSTSVGSGALTLLKASLAACMIYVPGAAFASNSTIDTLFSQTLEETQPCEGFLMWSMVVVLLTATIWLALATYMELPVSSQQSIQGALLGTMFVTNGAKFLPTQSKNKNHKFIWIFMEWIVSPLIACVSAFFFFGFLKIVVLRQENPKKRILIFLPFYYALSAGLLCLFLMYQVIPHIVTVERWEIGVAVTLATLIGALLSLFVLVQLNGRRLDNVNGNSNSNHLIENMDEAQSMKNLEDADTKFEDVLKEFMEMRVLNTIHEEDERSLSSPIENPASSDNFPSSSQVVLDQCTPFGQLLESTPNQLAQTKKFIKMEKTTSRERFFNFFSELRRSTFHPVIEYDRQTLVRHALAEKFDDVEDFFSFPQLLASCIFALIQSSSEIAAVASPFGAILDIFNHRNKYSENGENVGSIHVTWWIRGIGGFGASIGFFLYGWRLTQCLGGKLTYVSNSRGLASQVCTVATVITMIRMKLPISSSHALIGSLLGVGVADDHRNVNWKLLIKFLMGWVFTILFCCGVAYGIYSFTIYSPAYVVP